MARFDYRLNRFFHWSSAVLILTLLASGSYMADGNLYALYDWHKAVGVLALLLLLARFYHSHRQPWPSSTAGSLWHRPVQWLHRGLLAACLIMSLSGLAYSGLAGYGVALFGLELIPSNYNEQGTAIAFYQAGSDLGKMLHTYVGYALMAVVLLHIAAALKHHVVDKDPTLRRMLGARDKSVQKVN